MGRALALPALSAADAAVLWQLCERFNEQAGAAWPSLARLAADTGRNQKTVQRSLKKLMIAGLVEVAQRGTRTASNRYRVAFEKVGASTPLGVGAPTPLGVGAPMSIGRGVDVLYVGAPAPLESIHEPGQETGFMNGVGLVPADAGTSGAAGTPPQAATPGTPNAGRRYPDFWDAYPKAADVFKTECAIQKELGDGTLLTEIVDGARRYAAHVKAQPWADEPKYTRGPLKWVMGKGWLDDWPTPKPPAKTAGRAEPDHEAAGPLKLVQHLPAASVRDLLRERFERVAKRAGSRACERHRAADRVCREFPDLAPWVVASLPRPDPWPPMPNAKAAAILSALNDEWSLVSSRMKAERVARGVQRGAAA